MNNPYIPGGVPTSAVLPPDYNPADINPYAPGMKLNQGMMQPQQFQQEMFMPQFTFMPQPTDGISSAVSQISSGMGNEYTNSLLSALGMGDVSQYQMQQPMMNPYVGMLSGYGMPAQPQFDPYALPTSPQANPFGGYTDYTGVNQDFIDARRNLIDALSSKAGMSPERAVRYADNSTFLNSLVNSMGGRRYGESSPTSDPTSSSSSSSSSTSTGGFI